MGTHSFVSCSNTIHLISRFAILVPDAIPLSTLHGISTRYGWYSSVDMDRYNILVHYWYGLVYPIPGSMGWYSEPTLVLCSKANNDNAYK